VVFVYTARYLHPTLRVGLKYVTLQTARTLFNYSVWAFVTNIAAMLRQGIDSLVIAGSMSASAVTHYTVGYRLVDYATHMQLQATNILGPLFTRYHTSGNIVELHNKVVLMTKINTLLAGYCAWMLVLLGGHFIHRWMGPEYSDAYVVLCVLALGFAAHLTFNPLSNAMFAIGKPRYIAVLDIIESLANVALSLVLVRYYGILGVAIGTTVPLVLFAFSARPITACKQIEMAPGRYYRAVVPMALLSLCLTTVSKLWISPSLPDQYLPLLAISVITFPFYLLLVLNLFFNKWEVGVLAAQVPVKLRRFVMPLLRHSDAV
jgi:O-antigen/teichoic acid export membrane protein